MRRYGRFSDPIWVRQRMDAKDRRFQRDFARRFPSPAAAVLAPTSQAPARFGLGDEVEVTNDAHVGEREIVLARGIVEQIHGLYPEQRYSVRGVAAVQDARTLRLVLRGGAR